MATMTSFFLDPAERAECVRNPEAFVFRSERVLGGLVQKLKRTEAKHSVERVDMEQTYHQLERSHAMLREDYQKISTQHAQYGSDRDALVEARDGALGEASKLRGQLRSRDLELSRLKDEAGEAAEERKRLLGANARKAQQLDALEKEVQQLRQQESGSRQPSVVQEGPGDGGVLGHRHALGRYLDSGGLPPPHPLGHRRPRLRHPFIARRLSLCAGNTFRAPPHHHHVALPTQPPSPRASRPSAGAACRISWASSLPTRRPR